MCKLYLGSIGAGKPMRILSKSQRGRIMLYVPRLLNAATLTNSIRVSTLKCSGNTTLVRNDNDIPLSGLGLKYSPAVLFDNVFKFLLRAEWRLRVRHHIYENQTKRNGPRIQNRLPSRIPDVSWTGSTSPRRSLSMSPYS
jgi:hypothetical protein